MKAIKILGHPLVLTIMFVMILISGESFGGPYIIYLLMAIPHAGIHGLLGMVGIIMVLAGLFFPGKGSANGKWGKYYWCLLYAVVFAGFFYSGYQRL